MTVSRKKIVLSMDLNRISLVQAGIEPPSPTGTLMCLTHVVTHSLVQRNSGF
jgi:hypothetical protein